MIKRLFHIYLALMFPFYCFIVLIVKALFTDNGFGNKWLPDSGEMLDIIRGHMK